MPNIMFSLQCQHGYLENSTAQDGIVATHVIGTGHVEVVRQGPLCKYLPQAKYSEAGMWMRRVAGH